jgi:pre-mRNA-processing factor 40
VFHNTTFSTTDRLFLQHPIWQQAWVESECKLIFDEYVAELKQHEVVWAMFTCLKYLPDVPFF